MTNSFSNSHTGNDEFIKKNMTFVSKATNWARFVATASLGVINIELNKEVISYLFLNSCNLSISKI